jgi:hypothetical protein
MNIGPSKPSFRELERRAMEEDNKANSELDPKRRAQRRLLARDLQRQTNNLKRPH